MNNPNPAFNPDMIIFEPEDIFNKKQCLELICQTVEQKNPALKRQFLLEALYRREQIGHTAIVPQVAIPHARVANLSDPIGVITKLKEPIAFSSKNQAMVDILFTLFVPESATENHLSILADLAQRLKQPKWVSQLSQSTNPEELWNIFCDQPE